MSNLHQEKTSILKIASHARLQREEEEESWISSEELRTDGSSDEENKPKSKIPKVKQTKRARCAQMKRKEDVRVLEDTSKCKLPSISNSTTKKEEHLDDDDQPFDCTKACSSNYYAKRKSLQESIRRSHDIDVLWRPKRGSITLPVGPDGGEKSIKLIALEMNDFYLEMAAMLKELREERREEDRFDCVSLISVDSDAKLTKDPKLCVPYTKVKQLDEQLDQLNVLLKDVKDDRIDYQTQVCNLIKRFACDKNAKKFLKIFRKDEDKDEDDEDDQTNAKNDVPNILPKIKAKKRKIRKKDFIKRNIELAKEPHKMASLCLTDEEKTKLTELLADLDSNKYSLNETLNETKSKEESKECGDIEIENVKENVTINKPFKFNDEDAIKMTELEKKLTILLQPDLETNDVNRNPKTVEELFNEKDGKFWKHQLLLDRLKEIDNEIYLLQKAKLQEIKNKIDGKDDNDDNKDVEETSKYVEEAGNSVEEAVDEATKVVDKAAKDTDKTDNDVDKTTKDVAEDVKKVVAVRDIDDNVHLKINKNVNEDANEHNKNVDEDEDGKRVEEDVNVKLKLSKDAENEDVTNVNYENKLFNEDDRYESENSEETDDTSDSNDTDDDDDDDDEEEDEDVDEEEDEDNVE